MVSLHALQQGGVLSQHALQQGGTCSRGVCPPGGLLRLVLAGEGECLLLGQGGGVCSWAGVWRPPGSRLLLLRMVRILLECILVDIVSPDVDPITRTMCTVRYLNLGFLFF